MALHCSAPHHLGSFCLFLGLLAALIQRTHLGFHVAPGILSGPRTPGWWGPSPPPTAHPLGATAAQPSLWSAPVHALCPPDPGLVCGVPLLCPHCRPVCLSWFCHAHTCLFPSLALWAGLRSWEHPTQQRCKVSFSSCVLLRLTEPSGQNSALRVQGPGTFTSRPAEAQSCPTRQSGAQAARPAGVDPG